MKKYSHSRVYGNRVMNWRTAVLSLSIVGISILSHYGNIDNTYTAEQEPFMVPVVVQPEPTIEDKLKQYFPKSHVTMLAIAHAESGLSMNAKNWNCWYNKEETIIYKEKVADSHSTSCHQQDRKFSWSMDCGLLMQNYIGVKDCPDVSIDQHLTEMAELSKARGYQPWYAWQNGSYKKYLVQK